MFLIVIFFVRKGMIHIVTSVLKLMSMRIMQRQPSIHEGSHGGMTSAELNDPEEVQMISTVCQEDIHHCHSDTESSNPKTRWSSTGL